MINQFNTLIYPSFNNLCLQMFFFSPTCRFCVGDKFYLCDNKILCEYDYEERMVFANMTCSYNALSQIKKQTQSLSDDLSSGYGSPSPNSLQGQGHHPHPPPSMFVLDKTPVSTQGLQISPVCLLYEHCIIFLIITTSIYLRKDKSVSPQS